MTASPEHQRCTEVDHGVTVTFCAHDGEDWPCPAVKDAARTRPAREDHDA